MRRTPLLILALLLVLSSTLAAHDLFLKLSDYLVRAGSEVRITALNGTFTSSENTIARARVADLALVGPDGRARLDTTQLRAAGTRTVITTRIGPSGTYVLGLSIRPSQITMTGEEFNAYLKEEGLGHVVAVRQAAGELSKGATERYAKHVKAVFQAGATRTASYGTVLGYPAEIVPLQNPYALHRGDTLRLRLLVNGAPAVGLEAIAGGRTAGGASLGPEPLRSNADGIVSVVLRSAGTWYVKFISMTRAADPGIDYISQWATLTFAILPAPGKAP